jgi:hypothetical protein
MDSKGLNKVENLDKMEDFIKASSQIKKQSILMKII